MQGADPLSLPADTPPAARPALLFDVQLAETRPGVRVNEDVVGHSANAAWVIDGASGVGANLVAGQSDARWFAMEVDRALKAVLAADPDIPIAELLTQVITHCADAYAAAVMRPPQAGDMPPSAAFAFARYTRGSVELVTLGDCEILYRLCASTTVTRHCDSGGLAELEGRTIALASRLLAADPNISQENLIAALRPQLTRNRKRMNQPGGYWILGLDTNVIAHLHQRVLPAGQMTLALASDGFLRLRDLFGMVGNEDLLNIGHLARFERMYSQLRALEDAPASISRFPRVKLRDDASFVRVTLHTNDDPPC
jgi:hypothetical protein